MFAVPWQGVQFGRLSSTGILDTTYGTNGYVTTTRNDAFGTSSMLIQPDEKIIIAGSDRAARYTTNGALDPTFGDAGISEFHQLVGAVTAAFAPDRKLVLAGQLPPEGFGVARMMTALTAVP